MRDTRYFLLLAAVTLLTVTGTAQNKELKKANQLYDAFEYKAASALLEKCLQKYPGNKPAAERLAECYVKLNDTGKSEYWLSVVCTIVTSNQNTLNSMRMYLHPTESIPSRKITTKSIRRKFVIHTSSVSLADWTTSTRFMKTVAITGSKS
jgi:hypothetical protein